MQNYINNFNTGLVAMLNLNEIIEKRLIKNAIRREQRAIRKEKARREEERLQARRDRYALRVEVRNETRSRRLYGAAAISFAKKAYRTLLEETRPVRCGA